MTKDVTIRGYFSKPEGVREHRSLGNTGLDSSKLRLKCDGTRAETRFRLSAKRTSPFKSARVSVQSTTGSRAVRISGSNAGYIKFRGSAKGTGYPLHPVSPTLPLPCVIVCHHISTGLYHHTINIIILLCEILRHNVALLQNVCN